MIKTVFLLILSIGAITCSAQIRLEKLVLDRNQKFTIQATDILVVDTLIMNDSSSIFLNLSKTDNFIHAKAAIIGKGCTIIGNGKRGEPGNAGEVPRTQTAPCRNGFSGATASNGTQGQDAVNLSLYLTTLKINGSIIINLNGGDGGAGGKGGSGGDGGSGSRVCPAGDGGKGGNGANGGIGGKGGTININCKKCDNLNLLMGGKLIVKNFGGFGGLGGDGGPGGRAGLGSLRDGKNGQPGASGKSAAQGRTGAVNLSIE